MANNGRQAVAVPGTKHFRIVALAACIGILGTAVQAQQARGPVTNLPLPRFVSMKTGEGNVRRGPSLTHRIDWVFKRRDMPLQITAEYGHWRRVRDREGAGGWVHYALLSGSRTVLIEEDMLPARTHPDPKAPVAAAFELGVVARLGKCLPDWCQVTAGGYRGWAPKDKLWGVAPEETRD
ncbi:SH3 domain-containing protein [Aliisedimentitalea scapharcae]|uniref:SH3 domain-containing protein n=1 Tax=Aliisedimentitalea scapharcae TaxID=1524259 RepID=A0ABZ2XQ81_9RHOB|nr:aspartyl-trna synthetase [Rhodobacteraceae bacterium M382]